MTGPSRDRGQASCGELVAELDGVVLCRAFVRRIGGTPTAEHLEVTSGLWDEPVGHRWWDYGALFLAEALVDPAELSTWLGEGQATLRPRRGEPVRCSLLFNATTVATWEQVPSLSGLDHPRLQRPYRRTIVRPANSAAHGSDDPRWLVGDDAPAMPSPDAAYQRFFRNSFDPAFRGPHDALVIRDVLSGPYISGVAVGAGEVAVTVAGLVPYQRTTPPVHVDVGSPASSHSERVWPGQGDVDTVSFPTPNVRGQWWVVVHQKGRWLDYRYLVGANADPASGVIASEDDASRAADIRIRIDAGEGSSMEFKESLPTSESHRVKLASTAAAFANGEGGSIIYGVRNDGTVAGLTATGQSEADRLTNIVVDRVTPPVTPIVDHVDLDGRTVFVVTIEPGWQTPYALRGDPDQVYVRRGATTRPAGQHELRTLARSRPTMDSARRFG